MFLTARGVSGSGDGGGWVQPWPPSSGRHLLLLTSTPPIPAHSSPSPWTAWAVTCSGKGVRGLCSPPSRVANRWDPPEQKRVKDAQPAWPKPLCFVQPHALCWAQVLNTQPNILYLEGPKPGQEYKHNVQESKRAVPPRSPRPGYSLLLSFGSVTEEEEGCGQEEHPSQDNDKRAEHEGIAQAEELPHRGLLCALSDQVGDLRERGKKFVTWMENRHQNSEGNRIPETTHPTCVRFKMEQNVQ